MTGAADEPRWFVVDARVDQDELDVLSGMLWAIGVAGIEERPTDHGLRIVVSVSATQLEQVRTTLGDRTTGLREARADEGLDGWKVWARPTRVGDIVIEPAWWAPADTVQGAVTLRIDPGHAFGSGAHVTTRLTLALMQTLDLGGRTVLDVGTGSGVLAIAAAALGAKRVVGVDVDLAARDVARANVSANHVDPLVEIVDASIDGLKQQFAIVVANIGTPTLIGLAGTITARLEAHGTLILSGMLAARALDVTAAFPDVSFGERRSEMEWVAIAGERHAFS
jgi:ribosomal protein L11 methyltransferase